MIMEGNTPIAILISLLSSLEDDVYESVQWLVAQHRAT